MAKRARTILVTGASRGLGLGIARRLTATGFDVIALARQKTKAVTDAMTQAKRAKHGALHFVPFDLGKVDDIAKLVRNLRQEFGPLFGLVNNAAVGHDGALAMMHNSQIEELVRVNTLSPIVLTKYVVRAMMSERAGRVVNVASIIGFTGYSGLSVYAAIAGPRSRAARYHCERGGAGLCRYRHDPRPRR
jgi:3-oxoacyl-[acyl-carrier protein] reductase